LDYKLIYIILNSRCNRLAQHLFLTITLGGEANAIPVGLYLAAGKARSEHHVSLNVRRKQVRCRSIRLGLVPPAEERQLICVGFRPARLILV